MIRMTSTLPTLSCTRSMKSMRSYTGWPQESSLKWSWNVRNSPLRLMKIIKPLEHLDLRTIFLLKRPRDWMLNCFRLEHN